MAGRQAGDTQPGPGIGSIVTVVAAAVTLAGSFLTTIGISTGVITALLRNNTGRTLVALGITVLGIILGIGSTLVRPGTSQRTAQSQQTLPTLVAIASLLVFFAGIFWLAALAANYLKTTQRPAITATVLPLSEPAGFATLEATVTASGMSTNDRYFVEADLVDKPDAPKPKSEEIFFAYAGPKSDGTFEYKFKVTFQMKTGYSWIGITAHLQKEARVTEGFQKCGLASGTSPAGATSTTSGGPAAGTTSTTLGGPAAGTTCTVAFVPTTTTTTTTTTTRPPK